MRITDIKPLKEDASEPFVVRLLRRAIARDGKVAIDYNATSGRKYGWLIKEPEVGTGWRTGLGDFIPTFRFTVQRKRAMQDRPITFELPAEGVDNLMTLTKKDGKLLIINAPEKVNEMQVAGEPAMWIGLAKKALDVGKKLYFASGANQITAINDEVAPGVVYVMLVNPKTGKKQTYTIQTSKSDEWTLQKFEDGHRLTMVQNVKKPVTEAAEDPTVYSMFHKLLADGQKVFFRNRGGKKTQLRHAMTGVSTSGKQAWWFFDSDNPAHRKAIVWKVGETIDKLTLKKDGDDWVLFDKTVKLKEERGDEPTVITLINKRIALQGAVNVDIIQNGKQVRGWITEPIVPSPFSTPEHFYYKTILHKMTGNSRAFILGTDADALFRVTQQKEKNGKTTLKLVSREGAQDAAQ